MRQGADRLFCGGIMGVRGLADRKVSVIFRKDEREVDFGVRRFRLGTGPRREAPEGTAQSFITGFNAALSAVCPAGLSSGIGLLRSCLPSGAGYATRKPAR